MNKVRKYKPKISPITFNGRTISLIDWQKETGINIDAISKRIKTGWTIQEALTTPIKIQKD